MNQIDVILKDAVNEWSDPSGELSADLPDKPNSILSHVVFRLLDIVDPPKAPPTPPYMPKFLLRAAIIGKPFTGKTSTLHHLNQGNMT